MVKTVSIVSLSSGVMGESFLSHEIRIGTKRLERMGLKVKFAPNALTGTEHIRNHPEARAADLLEAFRDEETDMILCAIGGDDTYRLLPYLFENDELKNAVSKKVFLGFSDTTINHLMLHKVGLPTFYGQAFLPDVCELDREMLPYTKKYFEELIFSGKISSITPSNIWYNTRTDFGKDQIGTPNPPHRNRGFELLQGDPLFSGKILGGCVDTFYDIFDGERHSDMPFLCKKYALFPSAEDWKRRILLLETSEEKPSPQKYRKALEYLKSAGVFDAVSGVLVGKPMDETYDSEYKRILKAVIGNSKLPVLCNINVGHALPRCIIPFGITAAVDAKKQQITFEND